MLGNSLSTSFLMNLDAHLLSASLHTSEIFLPENPFDYFANFTISFSCNYFAYRLNIAILESSSGSSNLIERSILLSIA